MKSTGVIYYNRGQKMLVRLAVSLFSLRKTYDGPVTILSQGDDSHDACKTICSEFGANMQRVDFKTPSGSRDTYLNATLAHEKTPYDITVWLDSDTIVLRPFDALFAAADEKEFAICQFSTWTTQRGKIAGRIKAWSSLYPDWINDALQFGHAINCGVFAFRKDSSLMRDWWRLAVPGRELSFIPDETCCQLILPRYPHMIMPAEYNVSCKYGERNNARIIHYHGRKHCRLADYGIPTEDDEQELCSDDTQTAVGTNKGPYLFMADIWYSFFDTISFLPVVQKFIEKDNQLRKALKAREKLLKGKS